MLQINSMPDHIHILVGFRPNQSMSAVIQNIKAETTKWINNNEFCSTKFAWQEGFGAFSYSKSHLPNVINYIINQEKHHKKLSFNEEYRLFLENFDIEYDERYLFQEPQ